MNSASNIIKLKTEKTNYDISEEEGCLIIKKDIKKRRKQVESLSMKTLPSLFFVLFLLIFCLILIKFAPNFIAASRSNDFYKIRNSVKYLPEYIGEESEVIKVLIIISQIIFLVIIVSLTSLIRQRISVPELISEKSKNYSITFTSIISVASMIGLTLFKEKTNTFSKHYLGLVDNIFYLTFLTSSFLICQLSYLLLKKVDVFCVMKDSKFLYFKKIILFAMIVNLSLYTSCLLLISYYTPIIPIEQRFTSCLMVLKEINSILFFFNYIFFIFTMKDDLNYIQSTLEIRPDLEFFIDTEDMSKYILYEKGPSY